MGAKKAFGMPGAAMALLLLCVAAAGIAGCSSPGSSPLDAPPAAGPGISDFTLPDTSGRMVSLGQFLGKEPLLLIFWATWCPYCREAVPAVNRMHADPSAHGGVRILALDYKESREKVAAFIAAKEVEFPVLLDRDGGVARAYGVAGIPTYVLIDRTGKAVYRGHEIPEISRHLK